MEHLTGKFKIAVHFRRRFQCKLLHFVVTSMNLQTTLSWLLSGAFAAFLFGTVSVASAAVFPDVSKDHFAREAIIYLSDRGTLAGYDDGTFKPDRKVNRAEALKVIASAFIPKSDTSAKSTDFTDVPDNAWYVPSLKWGITKNVIDGPPKTTRFYPTRAVTKAEFLKMLFTANGVDSKAFSDIKLALSSDTTDTSAWYYPHLRYAVATATTEISDAGLFGPNRELTRGDVALILYRYTLYRSGERIQDLLTLTREDVEAVITALAQQDVSQAEYASARAILLARAALLTQPDEDVVKVAVKIAEGYRALTRAYRASISGDRSAVLKHATDASTLAAQALKLSPDSKILAEQLDKYGKSFVAQAKKK